MEPIEAFAPTLKDMAEANGGEPDLASVATAFADARRVRVLMALADGRALPAGRLAEEAGVGASTISSHLGLLPAHGLVTVQQQGRHRYYRLATPHVEGVLEPSPAWRHRSRSHRCASTPAPARSERPAPATGTSRADSASTCSTP